MVEKNTIASVHSICFTVVLSYPKRIKLCNCIWASWVKRRCFRLRHFLHFTIKFGSRSLVEFGFLFKTKNSDCFKKSQSTYCVCICRVFWSFKRNVHVTLSREVIDFVWHCFLHQANHIGRIG